MVALWVFYLRAGAETGGRGGAVEQQVQRIERERQEKERLHLEDCEKKGQVRAMGGRHAERGRVVDGCLRFKSPRPRERKNERHSAPADPAARRRNKSFLTET